MCLKATIDNNNIIKVTTQYGKMIVQRLVFVLEYSAHLALVGSDAGWWLMGLGVSPLVDMVCLWLMAEMRDRDSGVLSECCCLYCSFQVELGDMSLFLPSLCSLRL